MHETATPFLATGNNNTPRYQRGKARVFHVKQVSGGWSAPADDLEDEILQV